eukprot:GHVR01120871.1.p2 GENE.GHVR01120871.1~~GHVR01120871.1.p2  ORF type:complete len:104 (+),score=11.98 GHVR01120871.1:1390-1701(+)
MTISKEEIFGPVMSVLKYEHIDEVISRSNNSPFGLAAGIVSENNEEISYVTRKLKAGTIWVNCYNAFSHITPFGGYKVSGIGRELGEEGLYSYLEHKTITQKR